MKLSQETIDRVYNIILSAIFITSIGGTVYLGVIVVETGLELKEAWVNETK